MVGVPRSQGCRNCRRKKKGCDLERPACGRCAALGYECGYDEKRWTFVGHRTKSTESSRASDDSQPEQLTRKASESDSEIPQGQIQHSLSRTARQTELIGEFWFQFMPWDDASTVYIGDVQTVPWMKTVLDLSDRAPTTLVALNAVALTIVGRTKADQSLLRESTRQYSLALSETNRALQDPAAAQGDDVLACCKILAIYEQFRVKDTPGISTQGFDWHNHVDGMCGLVELRGPAMHATGHGHALFADLRTSALTSAITRRRPSRLTDSAWHTTPWEQGKSLHDDLVDVMLTVPDLLAQQDRFVMRHTAMETESERFDALSDGQNLIYRCIRIGELLNAWETKVLRAAAAAPLDPASNATGTLQDICTNHGYGLFNSIQQYWVTCLILYSTTWTIYKSFGGSERSPWPRLPNMPSWMDPESKASCIAFHAYHYFDENAGYWGASRACFPLGAVAHYYAATNNMDSAGMEEVSRLFTKTRYGKLTKEFLRSVANTPNSLKGDSFNREEHIKMANSWYRVKRSSGLQCTPSQ